MIPETTLVDPNTTGTYTATEQVPTMLQQDEQDKLLDYNEAIIQLKRLISDWSGEVEDTNVRRKTRDVEIDVEALRQNGDLDEDETLIPDRVIDENITREQPPYINYLKNSRRICTFRAIEEPTIDSDLIEQEYTRGMTYSKWEVAYYKCLDGAQTHGWDAVEVVFDPAKPLNVGIEHIGHDMLFFPRSVKDIQQAPRLTRAYDVTFIQLKKWVTSYGFDASQVEYLIAKIRDTQKNAETIRIYKLFFKKDGIVWVAWFSNEGCCKDWLKKPEKLFVGISKKEQTQQIDPMTGQVMPLEQWVDADVEQYPIFQLFYRETEKAAVMDHKGRVFLDENKQEAQTAILSGFVNGLTRASNIYASPDTEDGSGDSLRELNDIKLVGNRILSKPMKFWGPNYPDPLIIKAMQHFDNTNSQETNQVNYASLNREDSRKTATEIGAAEKSQAMLNSVQLTLFSTFIREVNGFGWLIVQSQALQNKIIFLRVTIQEPIVNPLTGQPVIGQDGQPQVNEKKVNNIPVIGLTWELRAAGDVDVVQKQELITAMQQDWPVIANTPLKNVFLADYIKLKYPNRGEAYAQILQQSSQMEAMKSMIARMTTILQGSLQQHPEDVNQLPQQQRADLMQLIQEGASYTQPQPSPK